MTLSKLFNDLPTSSEKCRLVTVCEILISGQADSVWSDCTEATADHWPLYKCHPAPLSLSHDNKN